MVNDEELYLFDLRGYLVIKAALTAGEVTELNELIDGQPSWEQESGGRYAHTGFDMESMAAGNSDPDNGPIDFYSGLLLDWGEPVRQLVGHPSLLPYLQALIGSDCRLDHAYAIFQKKGHGAEGHELHGGGTPHDPTQFYAYHDGMPRNGLVAFSVALTDVPSGAGGFVCVPGSHKSNMPFPKRYKNLSEPADAIVHVPVDAGDVIVFTEALSHGAMEWSADHERRVLMFKYCPSYMQWEKGSPFIDVDAYQWTRAQRQILQGPYFWGRDNIQDELPIP